MSSRLQKIFACEKLYYMEETQRDDKKYFRAG
jgi:hypothetical protein